MTTKELAQLTVPQRISLAEELWDSVSTSVESEAATEIEKSYIDRRLAEIKTKKEKLVNWTVLKNSVRNRKK